MSDGPPPDPGAPSAPSGPASPIGGALVSEAQEACPLCGTPLRGDQDWCLHCGAAARTRLAATPRWRAPLLVLAVTLLLCAGALTAALVKLSGGSGTTTVQTGPPVTVPAPAAAPTAPLAAPPTGPSGTTGPSPTTTGATGQSALAPGAGTRAD